MSYQMEQPSQYGVPLLASPTRNIGQHFVGRNTRYQGTGMSSGSSSTVGVEKSSTNIYNVGVNVKVVRNLHLDVEQLLNSDGCQGVRRIGEGSKQGEGMGLKDRVSSLNQEVVENESATPVSLDLHPCGAWRISHRRFSVAIDRK